MPIGDDRECLNMCPGKGERIVAGSNEALIKSAAEDVLRLSLIEYLDLGEHATVQRGGRVGRCCS